jgi:hypothetical protein
MRTALWVSWSFTSLSLAASAADLTESRFTQVINEVSVITPGNASTARAAVNDLVRSPQMVRTGPASRAELLAQDQTLTRVGANTLFSFDPRGRTINLQQGSVLFHSPTGRGGGTIKTGGASAAVLGTTLMIVATPNGGFKGIVLEGKGRFTLPNGTSRNLNAGQLLFVLPGSRSFGPTLNVNLGKMVEGSGLVKGYTAELPSLPKVQAAVSAQQVQISTGKMQDTGLLVGNDATKDTVTVIDPATFAAAVKENKTKVDKALNRDLTLDSAGMPLAQIFPRSRIPKSTPWSDMLSYALLGEDIRIAPGDVFVPPLGGTETPGGRAGFFGIIADDKLTFEGDTDFRSSPVADHPFYTAPSLALGAHELRVADDSTIRFLGNGDFYAGADKDITLKGVRIEAQSGSLWLESFKGDIDHDGGALSAGQAAGRELTVAADGKVKLQNLSLSGRTIRVSGGDLVEVRHVTFTDPVRDPGGLHLPSSITMEADTLVLAYVDLPHTPVNLRSRKGILADNPNTGAATRNGYVNFYRGVTVGSRDASEFVHTADNPSGNIFIGTLSSSHAPGN